MIVRIELREVGGERGGVIVHRELREVGGRGAND